MCLQILKGGGSAEGGGGSGKRQNVVANKNYGNEVWVPVEPTGEKVSWRGANQFGVACCKDAFSPKSHCKFAFCPPCAIEVRGKLFASNNNAGGGRSKRSRASTAKDVTILHKAGNHKEKSGGECGKHKLKDMMTVDYVQTDSKYLKSKNEGVVGAENIAVHCVFCGIKF